MAVQDRDFRYKKKTSMFKLLKPKIGFEDFAMIFIVVLFLWVGVTSAIQRFSNPKLTETELILLIPQNAILEFK